MKNKAKKKKRTYGYEPKLAIKGTLDKVLKIAVSSPKQAIYTNKLIRTDAHNTVWYLEYR